ncbi:MAG: methylcrotonoyl-CoA carboxylase, partial [Bdellovibrionales bacterium]
MDSTFPLETNINNQTSSFKENHMAMKELVDDMRSRLEKVKLGGGQKSLQRLRSQNKLTARER